MQAESSALNAHLILKVVAVLVCMALKDRYFKTPRPVTWLYQERFRSVKLLT